MKALKNIFFFFLFVLAMSLVSCDDDKGANPFDPDTDPTATEMPEIHSFAPTEGKTGDVIEITGINFETATAVEFGGKSALSFEIISETKILATVGDGSTGKISVTNHKGALSSTENFMYIEEVESDNLAFNKVVTASSSFANSEQNAVDGNDQTRWSAGDATDNHWLTVDLGKVYPVGAVRIMWEGAYASEYEILLSTDNVTFTSAAHLTNQSFSDKQIATHIFTQANARYVKLQLLKNATPWNMSLWEFEVYSEWEEDQPGDEIIIPEAGVNVALGKAGSTSSTNSWLAPALALDGDPASMWQAADGSGDNQWFLVDLGAYYQIGRVHILWDIHASEYEIQVSLDGVDYTPVYSTTAGTEVEVDHPFTATNARYVKLLMHKNSSDLWSLGIKEFEVYGN